MKMYFDGNFQHLVESMIGGSEDVLAWGSGGLSKGYRCPVITDLVACGSFPHMCVIVGDLSWSPLISIGNLVDLNRYVFFFFLSVNCLKHFKHIGEIEWCIRKLDKQSSKQANKLLL